MRRWKTLILLAMTLALVLTGCGLQRPAWLPGGGEAPEAEAAEGGFYIYRLHSDASRSGDLLTPELSPGTDAAALEPDAALTLFLTRPADPDLTCALPPEVTVVSSAFENGVVTLTLSDSFLDLTGMARSAAAFGAVLTLCQLEGVEAVTVVCGGETVFSGLMPADALLTAADSDPYIRRLRLYFADADGRYLISEYHSLTLEEDASAERYVVEELLRGPNNGELRSALPPGTALRSCSVSGGVCTVDLTAPFLEARPTDPLGERLAVYSLVDSLTALTAVRSVRILVEGEPVGTYTTLRLDEPLVRYEEPIGPASPPKGEYDADLYLALPGLTELAALPFRVNVTGYESRAEAVLSQLLTAAEPGYPALFPSSASVLDVTVRGTRCAVDLSEGFFASIPEEQRAIAAASMTATLCALPEIESVRFTIAGAAAVFDGADWTGPWYSIEDFID